MNQRELMAAIESLPTDVQFDIANSILERLTNQGLLLISEEVKAEFMRREMDFNTNPDQGESWEYVQRELFGG